MASYNDIGTQCLQNTSTYPHLGTMSQKIHTETLAKSNRINIACGTHACALCSQHSKADAVASI